MGSIGAVFFGHLEGVVGLIDLFFVGGVTVFDQ